MHRVKSAWIMPSYVKNAPHCEVENIDLTSAMKLISKNLMFPFSDNLDSSKEETLAIAKQDNPEIAPPSPGELIDFYTKLN